LTSKKCTCEVTLIGTVAVLVTGIVVTSSRRGSSRSAA